VSSTAVSVAGAADGSALAACDGAASDGWLVALGLLPPPLQAAINRTAASGNASVRALVLMISSLVALPTDRTAPLLACITKVLRVKEPGSPD
jgi:hypothetical protein